MKCTRPVLERTKTGPVEIVERPCGKCPACRSKKAQEWVFRLYAEMKCHEKAVFVTLTFDDEHIDMLPVISNGVVAWHSLAKWPAQNFMKSLRKNAEKKLRYYIVGEYGETSHRPHLHGIIFGLGPDDRNVIEKSWPHGFVSVGTVTPSSIGYVARYCVKKLFEDTEEYKDLGLLPEFSLQSLKPGIGFNAIEKGVCKSENGGYYVWYQGRRQAAPRYFVDKVRSVVEKIAAQRLSVDVRDARIDEYECNGRSEVLESIQSEKNTVARRRARARV